MERIDFCERLFNELQKRNIKKTKFYEDLGLSRTTILNWKRGSKPSADKLLNICKYLNISPYYLYFGINENEELKVLRDKAQKYDEMIRFMESLK